MLAEQELLLVRQMFRIGVDRDVVSPRRLGEAGCSRLDVVGRQAVHGIDLALPVHRRLLVLLGRVSAGARSWGEIRMAFGRSAAAEQFRPGLCTKLVAS